MITDEYHVISCSLTFALEAVTSEILLIKDLLMQQLSIARKRAIQGMFFFKFQNIIHVEMT